MRLTESPKRYIGNAKPSQNAGYERLGREDGRLIVETFSTGLFRASRSPEESAEQRSFVKKVSVTGAELVVNLLQNGQKTDTAVAMGRLVKRLQRDDGNMFPDMQIIEKPDYGVTRDQLKEVLAQHANLTEALSDTLPTHQRANREDAALGIVEFMSAMVEANPEGLDFDHYGMDKLAQMARAHDTAFPPEQ